MSRLVGRVRVLLLGLGALLTVALLRPKPTFACGLTDIGCGVEALWYRQLINFTTGIWSLNRTLLLLARAVETLRAWLISDVLTTAFTATLRGVGSLFWIVAIVALLIFVASFMLQAIIDLRWVDARKALRATLIAYVLFTYGSQAIAETEKLRVGMGQFFQEAAQSAVGTSASSLDFRVANDNSVPPNPSSIYGSGSTCPGISLARSTPGMYINDYAANFLRASATDIHCPDLAFRLPAALHSDSFMMVYAPNPDISDLDPDPRSAATATLIAGTTQMLLGIPLCIAAVLEQVMHLIFTVAVAAIWLGLIIALIFVLFLPTEGLFRAQIDSLKNVLVASWIASFWTGIMLAAVQQATQSGNSLMVVGFSLLVLLVLLWQMKTAAETLMAAAASASSVVGSAPQAVGGAAMSTWSTLHFVTGRVGRMPEKVVNQMNAKATADRVNDETLSSALPSRRQRTTTKGTVGEMARVQTTRDIGTPRLYGEAETSSGAWYERERQHGVARSPAVKGGTSQSRRHTDVRLRQTVVRLVPKPLNRGQVRRMMVGVATRLGAGQRQSMAALRKQRSITPPRYAVPLSRNNAAHMVLSQISQTQSLALEEVAQISMRKLPGLSVPVGIGAATRPSPLRLRPRPHAARVAAQSMPSTAPAPPASATPSPPAHVAAQSMPSTAPAQVVREDPAASIIRDKRSKRIAHPPRFTRMPSAVAGGATTSRKVGMLDNLRPTEEPGSRNIAPPTAEVPELGSTLHAPSAAVPPFHRAVPLRNGVTPTAFRAAPIIAADDLLPAAPVVLPNPAGPVVLSTLPPIVPMVQAEIHVDKRLRATAGAVARRDTARPTERRRADGEGQPRSAPPVAQPVTAPLSPEVTVARALAPVTAASGAAVPIAVGTAAPTGIPESLVIPVIPSAVTPAPVATVAPTVSTTTRDDRSLRVEPHVPSTAGGEHDRIAPRLMHPVSNQSSLPGSTPVTVPLLPSQARTASDAADAPVTAIPAVQRSAPSNAVATVVASPSKMGGRSALPSVVAVPTATMLNASVLLPTPVTSAPAAVLDTLAPWLTAYSATEGLPAPAARAMPVLPTPVISAPAPAPRPVPPARPVVLARPSAPTAAGRVPQRSVRRIAAPQLSRRPGRKGA